MTVSNRHNRPSDRKPCRRPARLEKNLLRAAMLLAILFALHRAALGADAIPVPLVPAQPPQEAPVPDRIDDPYDHLLLGRRALDAGRRQEACEQYSGALAHRPRSLDILKLLLKVAADDADARTLWSHAWYAAAADAEGRVKPDRTSRDLLAANDPHLSAIAFARARAVSELIAFAEKRASRGTKAPEELLVAWWARRLALELAAAAPALERTVSPGLNAFLDVPESFHDPVIRALEQVLKNALSNEQTGTAMRAARSLHGLAVQAGFKDLKGPRPKGMDRVRAAAAAGLARARAQLESKIGDPWTIDELDWLSRLEGEAFTRDHASFANPGAALSPNGLYRIETDCGFETLRGVTLTIELHHARLVNWFGLDPFKGRRGIVRIVPEAHGLESEGTPFWWAGGMQGGDTTTMRLACGTIEGLGHGLTHELTHRFDGAVYPGLPGWLLEGRAVWTGGAYGSSSDTGFVPNHASFGTIQNAFIKGYGGLAKLTELIEGTIEDYRDNYVAGYALYVYLASWEEEERKLYAERLERFMRSARGQGNRKAWFVKNFADGAEGRPDGLEAFAEVFQAFVRGFYWKTRQPWTERYITEVPAGPASPHVYDEPTWTWARNRAEPFFGQDHAREMGIMLLDLGRREDALHALVWALSADGRSPEVERLLGRTLKDLGKKDAAWVMEHVNAFPCGATDGPAPFFAGLRQTRILLQALEEAAAGYADSGIPFAAAATAAEAGRLAGWLGLPKSASAPLAEHAVLHPLDGAGRHAGASGWEEADLTGYEEHRVKNLWFEAANGDLHVGRTKPRRATGLLDRSAHLRHIYVRSPVWHPPGAYRLKTRIKFTTSFVSGAVVLGSTRRDRNVRFQFSAGDLMYAIGESEKEPAFESMNWRLTGLRERDGALPGSSRGGGFEFERSIPAFDLELIVEGAVVEAYINGTRTGAYHMADGTAIEGRIGFAAGYGAYCVQQPVIERLDRRRAVSRSQPLGLDLAAANCRFFKELPNLPCRGLPSSSNGTLLVWIPMPRVSEADGESFDPEWIAWRARRAAKRIHGLLEKQRSPQPWALAVPAGLGEERTKTLAADLRKEFANAPAVVAHRLPAAPPLDEMQKGDGGGRWVLFIDSAGIIRVVKALTTQMEDDDFDSQLAHWITVFRDHGRPARALPPYARIGEGESPEDEEPGPIK